MARSYTSIIQLFLCLPTGLQIVKKGTVAFICILFYFVSRHTREYKKYYKYLLTISSRNVITDVIKTFPLLFISSQSHSLTTWGNHFLEFGVYRTHTCTYPFTIQIYVLYVTFLTCTEMGPYYVYFSDTRFFFSYIVEIYSCQYISSYFHFHCYIALPCKNISQYSLFSLLLNIFLFPVCHYYKQYCYKNCYTMILVQKCNSLEQRSANFFRNGTDSKHFRLCSHMVSFTTIQLCYCVKVPTGNT